MPILIFIVGAFVGFSTGSSLGRMGHHDADCAACRSTVRYSDGIDDRRMLIRRRIRRPLFPDLRHHHSCFYSSRCGPYSACKDTAAVFSDSRRLLRRWIPDWWHDDADDRTDCNCSADHDRIIGDEQICVQKIRKDSRHACRRLDLRHSRQRYR